MKKYRYVLLVFSLSFALTSNYSCTPKVGCEVNQNMGPKVDKRGNMKKKKGKTNLFDKKTRKRMGY